MKKFLLILLNAVFASAWAAGPENKNAVRHETKEAAMRADGFDVYDTARNRVFMEFIISNHDRVISHLGSIYAGGWVEYSGDNRMRQIIAITKSIKVDSSIFPDDYYRFIQVKYSLNDLESVKNKIDGMFLQLYGVGFVKIIGINVKNNKIELSVSSENYQRANDGLARSGFDMDMVEIKVMDAEIRPLSNYYPGTKLMLRNVNGWYKQCTGGFVGSIGVYHALLTAGHCFEPIFDKVHFFSAGGGTGELIGNMLAYVNGGLSGKDYGVFSNANFTHMIWAGVFVPPSNIRSVKSPIDIVNSMVDLRVCAYGAVSGWGCAPIRLVNQIITTKYNIRLINFASFERCSFPGDSGGPIVMEIGDNAAGLVAADECAAFGGGGYPQTWFQPIKAVIQDLPNFILWTN